MFKNIPTTILHGLSAQAYIALRHMTLSKIINLIVNHFEYILRRRTLVSSPLAIKVEPTPLCHLRCPGCLHSDPEYKKNFTSNMRLNFDNFKKIIDQYANKAFSISLSLYGEPMLNKDIFKLVQYACQNNIGTSFPTNLSFKLTQEKIEKIVRSGLDMLIVSLDGTSEETYSRYRVGGNFNLVIDNVRKIAEMKKNLNLSTPHLRWKFIVFDYNAHEKKVVINDYKRLGFDSYVFVNDAIKEIETGVAEQHKQFLLKKKIACFWPWKALVVDWNGEIIPCCAGITHRWDIGNISQNGESESVWNGVIYKSIRAGFQKKDFGLEIHANCRRCYGLEHLAEGEVAKRIM